MSPAHPVLHGFVFFSFVVLKVVDYTGKRDLETLSKFLDDGGVLPEGASDEEDDEDDDVEEDGDDSKVCIFTATLYIFL